MRKIIVTGSAVIAVSKEFEGREDELAAKLDLQEYQVVEAKADKDFRTENEKVKERIAELESQITARRRDEAILGVDKGWLANQRELINIERNKLTGE